jgi:heme exporter protein B
MKPLTAIIFKDIVIELRNKEAISSMMMFGLLVLVIFSFAFVPSGAERALIAPGILWVAFAFSGILGLNRSLSMELDNDCLQGLLLTPLSRGELYLGKVISNFAFMITAELIILPIFVFFYNLRFNLQFLQIVAIAFLGTLAFASVGTILSTISANTRMKEVMLPVLQMPVIIASVEATGMVLAEETKGIASWLSLLAGFSMIYLVASYLVFDFVVEE